MKKASTYIIACLMATTAVKAQLHCTFTHYTLENGLSENTVMDIAQDHEGLIWVATWDGVNRFDGVNFKVYKARQNNSVEWNSNRIEQIETDAYGNVWCISYDGRAFRFDRRKEVFEEIPSQGEEGCNLAVGRVTALPDGTVWLLSDDKGGIRIIYNKGIDKAETKTYLASTAGSERTAHINSVHLDSKGSEWLLTMSGLVRVNGDESWEYFSNPTPDPKADHPFYSACELDESIYFGSTDGRIWEYSHVTGKFELIKVNLTGEVLAIDSIADHRIAAVTSAGDIAIANKGREDIKVHHLGSSYDFRRHPVLSVYIDQESEIWLGVDEQGAVCHFNPLTGAFRVERMAVEIEPAENSSPFFQACEDIRGNLWVHPTGGGLSWYDRKAGKLLPFYDEQGSPDWRFSNKLHSIMTDRQGNLWLGTHSKGLEKVTFYKNEFTLVKPKDCNYDTNVNHVRTIFEDKDHRFWIGTRDGKINVHASDMKHLGYLTVDGRIAKSGEPFIGVAYNMLQDSRGQIWIGTKGYGLLRLQGSGTTYKLDRFTHDSRDNYSISSNIIYDVMEDGKGRVRVVTFAEGINMIESPADDDCRFINSRNELKSYPMERCSKARCMVRDAEGNLWVGTSNGLLSFDENFSDPSAIDFRLHVRTAGDKDCLGGNNVYDMLLTSRGEMYFASFDGGLSRFVGLDKNGKGVFHSYTVQDGLPTDVLYSLAEDKEGNIWIGSENGLSRLSGETMHFDNFLRELDEGVIFEENTACSASDGKMLFGTNYGILSFTPSQIHSNSYVPDIVLSGLKVYGKDIIPGDGSILPESINSLERLVLSYDQDMVSISFSALDMTFPESIQYAYMLEGFDKGWNYIGRQQTATYTNLPHGSYTFRVRSTNGAGVWVDNARSLPITVKPSFWETPWAFILYVVVTLIVLAVGAYIFFTIFRLRHEVSVEKQITDLKLRFFTNISHELRTPLTLIAGPLENILNHSQLSNDVREQLQVVERNTDRMLRLVNQILDFRKIQNKKMKLRVEQTDIVAFVRKLMDNFDAMAKECGTDFVMESEQTELKIWVDPDALEKIIFNLLSNAFKYTPKGKAIKVFVHEDENSASIGVEDNGIGIPKNKQSAIFERFETLLDASPYAGNSSGIGLAFVKELVDLHHAQIHVDSEEGKGSRFTVVFPKGKSHFGEEVEFIVDDGVETDAGSIPSEIVDTEAVTEKRKTDDTQKYMLIVEDNSELRSFLRTVFASRFRIVEAADGQEGLEKAVQIVPDIIISDVSMPRKDGITMIRELRSNIATSHIPVVVLTAKADSDTRLRGIALGAESYITKPFSASYLEARVDNLLTRRESLQKFYYEQMMETEPVVTKSKEKEVVEETMSPQDKKFMERLTELMEKNIDNGELVVDDLAKELAVSRSVFFKKLKTLTGLAPIEFIKEMRVKRAAQLIETGNYSMTQISYMVGINDPRYFSRCFKQRFGMTPTEYKEHVRSGK